jgi:dTDP-4-amino-4,6-dideoxygalactose transaminase
MKSCSHLWVTQSFTDNESLGEKVLIPLPVRHNRSTMPVRLHAGIRVSVQSVQDQLAAQGIGTRLWYNPGLHRHPHWKACAQVWRAGESTLATVDRLNDRLIGLPFHNFLTPHDITFIVSNLRQIVENKEYSASLSQ